MSHGSTEWEEAAAARHEHLTAADYGRSKAGLGSFCGAGSEKAGEKAGVVATHYNSLPDRHRTLDGGSEILRVRNLNNWIKSVLIAKHLAKGRGGMGPAVLDLACGKGGDMLKFKAGNCAAYVGIDIAAQSVRDAVDRYNGAHGRSGMPFAATFMVGDFAAVALDAHLPVDIRFSLASCQFAIHYSFATEARARLLLANVAARLAAGGTFVATMPDANVLVRRLRAAPGLTFGNSLYTVTFDEAHASKRFAVGGCAFGVAYRFTLKEAVEDCEEYLVPLTSLTRLAHTAGLDLLYATNFTDFVAEECAKHVELLERMKVLPPAAGAMSALTEDEWEVAHTYMAVAFRKRAEAGADEAGAMPPRVRNEGHRRLIEQDIVHLGAAPAPKRAREEDGSGAEELARAFVKRPRDDAGGGE